MPRARTDGRMLVRSGFLVTPRMLADETESWAISICLSSMIVSPLLFKTTAAPAERGGRRERPERPAMKAGRTRRVGTKWRTRQGLRPAGRASEESDRPPRTAGRSEERRGGKGGAYV